MLGGSILVHAALLGAPALTGRMAPAHPEALPPLVRRGLAPGVASVMLPVSLAAARRELVDRARADRAAGRLALGEFLLEAGAIDAREEGRAFDLPEARARWGERLGRLRQAGALRAAIPEVFGDLHYYGRPGRSMGDALLEGGGACEPLAHLIAAAIHDLGHPERARLRFYGGEAEGGTTHLAPVYLEGSRRFDLLTGGPVPGAGPLIAAADLVDVYARAHGLDTAPPGSGGSGVSEGRGAAPGERWSSSMADGYPPNGDRYPGAVPLYAEHAVQAAGDPSAPASMVPEAQPADCAYYLRKAVLDPPKILVASPGDEPQGAYAGSPVELRRLPTPAQLGQTFSMVEAVERSLAAGGGESAERLVALACLTALYDAAATDFALASEPDLSRRATAKRLRTADEGARLLAGVDWAGPAGQGLLARLAEGFAGRSWLLLVLPGGEAPVLRLAGEAGRDDWGRTDALAALLVAPKTRAEALRMAEALPRRAQIDVMHEVFHVHDHQRPWASSYVLEGAGDFVRAYRVFRGLAWGLWEGARPADESLAALLERAAAAGLDRAWVAGLVDYYGRNLLGIHQARADGPAVAQALARWMEEHGFAEVEAYAVALAVARDPT